jgi:hypothetical protein
MLWVLGRITKEVGGGEVQLYVDEVYTHDVYCFLLDIFVRRVRACSYQ